MPGFAPASPPDPERALLIAMAEALVALLALSGKRESALEKALDDYRRETE